MNNNKHKTNKNAIKKTIQQKSTQENTKTKNKTQKPKTKTQKEKYCAKKRILKPTPFQNVMKILAFGDHHGDVFLLEACLRKEQKADLIINLGDFTMFSQDIELIFEELAMFKKPLFLTFGNHEDEGEVKKLAKYFDNISYFHKQKITFKEYTFLFYGGDGFSREDKIFEKTMNRLTKHLNPLRTILITHGPPYNTKIDIPYENHHSGSKSYRRFIEDFQPLLSLSGHIHQGEHLRDRIGKTVIMNPGPDGTIIDLDKLYERRVAKEKKEAEKKKKTIKKTKQTKNN